LMHRVVIQVSMLLALPLMAVYLYIWPQYAAWYMGYVVLFNMFVGPVFSAGSVTSERERQTLDLLLTTIITPWQILWAKLVSGLRVSSVLTSFLLWPVLLACIMPVGFWGTIPSMAAYILIIGLTCLTTAMTALFCSVLFHKSSTSLMISYLVIIVLFTAPLAASYFADNFFQDTKVAKAVQYIGVTSPFSAVRHVPLYVETAGTERVAQEGRAQNAVSSWRLVAMYVVFTVAYIGGLLATMIWLFQSRWRVSEK
jgi:ABC-type transport system involved in multi-copper enzyme maturation permease subunit